MRLLLLGAIALLPHPTSAAPAEVLHEYVPPPEREQAYRWAGHTLPEQIALPDRILPRPDISGASPSELRILDATSSHRGNPVSPDRDTRIDGLLDYAADFNPTVLPFKRMSVFDQVRPDMTLAVADETLRPLRPMMRPTPPDREAFWGSVALRLEAGVPVPLPSVAPDAVVVGYRSEPAAKLTFLHDSADNHWVSSDTTTLTRLVWLTDAPRRYFGTPVPPLVTLYDVPPELRPRLAAGVIRRATKVLRHIGIAAGPLRRQLERLVAYFRNFQPGELPQRTNSNYLDIALSQRGVCRHRSYAFVITAQALGLPARYVQNEAHAFVEVFIPRSGWTRIDLGGASPGVEVFQGLDKTVHRPIGPDPFPRPSRFAGNYSQRHSLFRGLGGLQSSGDTAAQATRGPRSRSPAAGGDPRSAAADSGSAQGGDKPSNLGVTEAPVLSVHAERASAFRGEAVQVWGKARTSTGGVGGLRVEVHLSSADGQQWILVGATATELDGSFSTTVAVPKHLPVGDYLIRVSTPETLGFPHKRDVTN